nr:hypothetical transcript [Hymenolepis microstoma]
MSDVKKQLRSCINSHSAAAASLQSDAYGYGQRSGLTLLLPDQLRAPSQPSWDSDLEGFNLNPPDGISAPLADRPGTYAKCLNLLFFS